MLVRIVSSNLWNNCSVAWIYCVKICCSIDSFPYRFNKRFFFLELFANLRFLLWYFYTRALFCILLVLFSFNVIVGSCQYTLSHIIYLSIRGFLFKFSKTIEKSIWSVSILNSSNLLSFSPYDNLSRRQILRFHKMNSALIRKPFALA